MHASPTPTPTRQPSIAFRNVLCMLRGVVNPRGDSFAKRFLDRLLSNTFISTEKHPNNEYQAFELFLKLLDLDKTASEQVILEKLPIIYGSCSVHSWKEKTLNIRFKEEVLSNKFSLSEVLIVLPDSHIGFTQVEAKFSIKDTYTSWTDDYELYSALVLDNITRRFFVQKLIQLPPTEEHKKGDKIRVLIKEDKILEWKSPPTPVIFKALIYKKLLCYEK